MLAESYIVSREVKNYKLPVQLRINMNFVINQLTFFCDVTVLIRGRWIFHLCFHKFFSNFVNIVKGMQRLIL